MFDHMTEGFIIINTRMLCEATQNPPSLVAVKRAIRFELVTKYPFACDKVDTAWSRHQGPGVICLQGVELSLHSKAPRWVRQGGANRGGHRRERRRVQVQAIDGVTDAILATCAYAMRIGDRDDRLRRCGSGAADGATGAAGMATTWDEVSAGAAAPADPVEGASLGAPGLVEWVPLGAPEAGAREDVDALAGGELCAGVWPLQPGLPGAASMTLGRRVPACTTLDH